MSLSIAVVASLASSAAAVAHFSAKEYSFRTSANCANFESNRVDPIGIIFYNNATGANVDAHIGADAGWPTSSSSGQNFWSHNACGVQSHERRSGSFGVGGAYSYHIRIRKTYDVDAGLGTTAQTTPHRDLILGCGHVADSYDLARNALVSAMGGTGHHPYYWQNWQNNAAMVQCDGRSTASSGQVAFMRIP